MLASDRFDPDNHIVTELTDTRLRTRLTTFAKNAREALAEQGVLTLYAAFGFLHWYESDDSKEEICSPLVLVPVGLTRENLDAPWEIHMEDEEILPNHAVARRLHADFQLDLPLIKDDITEDGCIDRYVKQVHQFVQKHYPRWDVNFQAAIGTFSFDKLAMWKDLDRSKARIEGHSLCRIIAGDPSATVRKVSDLPAQEELDAKTTPEETHHVLDADSSQHAAIVAAIKGCDMVLDGPPGTGKSQTIANMIAAFLARGQRVLFVSEKTAALEVVKRRLEECRLGDFCLELHSAKAKKREVISELERCLKLPDQTYQDGYEERQRLSDLRSQLNEYVKDLHAVDRSLKKIPRFR